MSLSHTDLVNKEPGGEIDHADFSITPIKLASPFQFGTFPLTPAGPPSADYEVANKKYVDDLPAGLCRYSEHRVGRVYGPTGGIVAANLAVTANRLYAVPFFTAQTINIDRIVYRVTTASTGTGRAGIYSSDGNCYPLSPLADVLTGLPGPAGVKLLVIDITLAPGLYWLVIGFTVTPTVTGVAAQVDAVNGLLVDDLSSIIGPCANNVNLSIPLPNPFPVAHGTGALWPLVAVRLD